MNSAQEAHEMAAPDSTTSQVPSPEEQWITSFKHDIGLAVVIPSQFFMEFPRGLIRLKMDTGLVIDITLLGGAIINRELSQNLPTSPRYSLDRRFIGQQASAGDLYFSHGDSQDVTTILPGEIIHIQGVYAHDMRKECLVTVGKVEQITAFYIPNEN